ALEPGNCLAVGDVIALAMRDRDPDHLPGIVTARERGVGTLDAQKDIAANEAELSVAHQHAGQESRFAGDLKSVAYRQHESALGGKGAHRVHDRRAGGDSTTTQVIAVREATRNDDDIDAGRQVAIGMPRHGRLAARDQPQRARHVALAIYAWEDDDSRFHRNQYAFIFRRLRCGNSRSRYWRGAFRRRFLRPIPP